MSAERDNGGVGADRRRHARIDVPAAVTYSCNYAEGTKAGHLSNLGGGGMRLSTDDDWPPGTTLLLRFTLPNVSHEFVVRGRTVLSFYNSETKQFLQGIAFTHIDPRDQPAITRYVASRESSLRSA